MTTTLTHVNGRELSYHASARMLERNITREQVRRALRIGIALVRPDAGRTEYCDGPLRVVVSHDDGSVMTVYWRSEGDA